MTSFKEGKIPYYNRIKYLSAEEQEEAIAILERAKENRDMLMSDRTWLKGVLNSIKYAHEKLERLEHEKVHLMCKIVANAPAEYFAVFDTDEESDEATNEATSEANEEVVSEVNEYGTAIPDYEGSEDESDSESEDEDI